MANYKLNTSGPFLQNNGSAITSQSTKVDGGSFKSQSNQSDNLRSSALDGVDMYPALVGGLNVAAGDWSLKDAGGSGIYTASSSNGFLQVIKSSGNLTGTYSKNSLVLFSGNNGGLTGTTMVTSSTASGFVTNIKYTLGIAININNYGTNLYQAKNSFGKVTQNNYTIKNTPNNVHGVTNNNYRSADINTREAVHNVTAIRTSRVASAIRAGYWNPYTATFSTAITGANDYGDEMTPKGTDTTPDDLLNKDTSNRAFAANVVFRSGAARPVITGYPAKT